MSGIEKQSQYVMKPMTWQKAGERISPKAIIMLAFRSAAGASCETHVPTNAYAEKYSHAIEIYNANNINNIKTAAMKRKQA